MRLSRLPDDCRVRIEVDDRSSHLLPYLEKSGLSDYRAGAG